MACWMSVANMHRIDFGSTWCTNQVWSPKGLQQLLGCVLGQNGGDARTMLLYFVFKNCPSIFCVKMVHGNFAKNDHEQFSPKLFFHKECPKCQNWLGWNGRARPGQNGRARPSPARPGLREMVRRLQGADLTKKLTFYWKTMFQTIFVHFWSF